MLTTNELAWVFLNGELVRSAEAKISPLGDGFMFGHALFETVRVLAGQPAFLSAHRQRLRASAATLGLELRSTEQDWRRESIQLAARNGHTEGVLKRVVFRDVDGDGELLTSRSFPYSEADYTRGFCLQIQSDDRATSGPAPKTTSYLKNYLARRKAKAEGGDEALFMAENGEVLEGAATNLFIVSQGRVFTPPVVRGIIPGVARGEIIARWKDRCEERAVTKEMLARADEIFVTNAVLGVMPVSRVGERDVALVKNGIVAELREEFARWQRESLG